MFLITSDGVALAAVEQVVGEAVALADARAA